MTAPSLRDSGTPIPTASRVGLPDPARPIRLSDGRRLGCTHRLPDKPTAGPGEMVGGSFWKGPKGLQVIVTLDVTDAWGPLLHASVAYAKLSRLPSWADITMVKDAVFGDVDAMMMLPKREDYVNLRPNCFQIVQTPERWAMQ